MIFIYIILGIIVVVVLFQIAAFTLGVLLALFRTSIGSAIIGGVLCYLFSWTSFKNGLIIGFVIGLIISLVQFFRNRRISYSGGYDYISDGDSGGGGSYESSSYSDNSDHERSHSYDNDNDYSYSNNDGYSYNDCYDNDYDTEESNDSFRRGTSSRNCGCCYHYKDSGGLCEYHSTYTSSYDVCDNFRE